MALWTGGRRVSTMRRVINPERGDTSSRVTIPFFYPPHHNATIEPLRPCTESLAGSTQFGISVIAGHGMSRQLQKPLSGTT
ncbi:2OG-Fe(II) oxygenase [Streptomyces sp. 769]|nr:2OG-Fe(II) oxygenase [Streptomyces sp. 769]